jgi:hypothetical protein
VGDLSADVSLDIGAGSGGIIADLLGKIHLGINDLAMQQAKQFQEEQRRLAGLPNYYTISKTTQAATADLIDFGSPQNGRTWIVRLLTGFSNDLTANASAVTWYVGQRISTAAGVSIVTNARWFFASLPAVQKFSGEIQLQPNEHLLAGITGIPASSNLVFNVAIEDNVLDDALYSVALS